MIVHIIILVYRFQFPFDYKTLEPLVEEKLNSLIQNSPNTANDMISMSMQSMLDTSDVSVSVDVA